MKLLGYCLCLVVLACVTVSCSVSSENGRAASPAQNSQASYSPEQPNNPYTANANVWIEDTNKLYVRMQDGSARLVARSKKHEGFYDPELSPNGKWVIVRTLYPNDIVGTRVSEEQALIKVSTGERIDRCDLVEKLGMECSDGDDMEWVQSAPATLRLYLTKFSGGKTSRTEEIEVEVLDSLDFRRVLWIEDTNKLYVRMQDGSARLVARSKKHEGFYDPELSPNGKWVIVRTLYPNDIVGTRVSEEQALIKVSTGERIDRCDLAEKLGIGCRGVYNMEWVYGAPATLRFSMSKGETEVEVPDSLDFRRVPG